MTAPVFILDPLVLPDFCGGEYVLDGPEGRHAVSVRRMRAGEDVVLTDGRGRWMEGVVKAAEGKDRLVVMDLESVSEEPAPQPRITVVQALPKGDRGELAVETMTETGVDAIVPWAASRCITQWKGERGLKALAKWRATAREVLASSPAGCASRRSRTRQRASRLRHFWPKPTSPPSSTRTATTAASPWPPPNSRPRARSCWSWAPKEASPGGVGALRGGGREGLPPRA